MRCIGVGVLGLASLVVGCDEGGKGEVGSTASAVASSGAASSGGLAGLKATVNGERLPLKTAVAFSRGGRGIELAFSTATPRCQDFAGNGRMLADGEQHFSVTIGPLLAKDGKETWGIGRLYFDSHTQQGGDLGEVSVTQADVDEGVTGALDFVLELKANDFMKKPARRLVVKGPFSAQGCGTFDDKDAPKKRPQKKLTLKVAGKPIAILAALVEPTTFPEPGHELLLSTAPASCDQGPSEADLTLKLNVAEAGRVQYAYVAGNVLSSQLNASPSADGPTLVAQPDGSLEGEGEVTIALKGELDVLGYPVVAEGEVTALRCPGDKK